MSSPALALIGSQGEIEQSTQVFRRRFEERADLWRHSPELESVLAGAAERANVSLDGVDAQLEAVTDTQGVRHALMTMRTGEVEAKPSGPNALLSESLDESRALIWLKDLDGRYLEVNRHFTEVLGSTTEEVRGKTEAEIQARMTVDGPRALELDPTLPEPLELEYSIPAFEGRPPMVALRFAVRDPQGKPVAVCGVAAPADQARVAREEAAWLTEVERCSARDASAVRTQMLQEWGIVPAAPGSDTPAGAISSPSDAAAEPIVAARLEPHEVAPSEPSASRLLDPDHEHARHEAEQARAEADAARSEADAARRESAEALLHAERLERDVEQWRQQAEHAHADGAALRARFEQADAEAHQLRARLEEAEADHRSLRARLEEAEADHRTLRIRLEENESITAEARRRADRAEAERAEAESARVAAEAARTQADTARREAETARSQAEAALSDAEAAGKDLGALRTELESARAAAERAAAEAERARAEAAAARDELTAVHAEAASAKADAEAHHSHADAASEELAALRGALTAAQADAEAARAEADATRTELATARTELATARNELAAALTDADAARAEREAARAGAAAANGELAALRAEAEKAKADAAAHHSHADAASEELTTLRADLATARADADAAAADAKAAQAEVATARAGAEAARAEVDELRSQLAAARREGSETLARVEAERDTADNEREAAQAEREAAQAEREAAQAERDAARAERDAARSESADLRHALEQHQADSAARHASAAADRAAALAGALSAERERVDEMMRALAGQTGSPPPDQGEGDTGPGPHWTVRAQRVLVEALSGATDWPEALDRALAAIGSEGGWNVVSAWTRDEFGSLRCAANWTGPVDAGLRELDPHEQRLGAGSVLGQAVHGSAVTWVSDLEGTADERLADAAGRGLRSGVLLPIRAGTATIGLLELLTRTELAPDPAMALALEGAALQVGRFAQRLAPRL